MQLGRRGESAGWCWPTPATCGGRPQPPAPDDDRGIGKPRVESARPGCELNPNVEIEIVAENVSEVERRDLVSRCDLVVGAAPLFAERLLMNREAVRQQKPLVDSSMYDLEGRVTTVLPGKPPAWRACIPSRRRTGARVSRIQRRGLDRRLARGDGSDQAGRRRRASRSPVACSRSTCAR
jgi:molybdopterin/thiamine biosynthesis adenylyltransferase